MRRVRMRLLRAGLPLPRNNATGSAPRNDYLLLSVIASPSASLRTGFAKQSIERRGIFLALLISLYATGAMAIEMSVEEMSKKKLHHIEAARFTNPWCAGCAARSRWDFFKWQLSSNPYEEEKKKSVTFNVVKPDFKKLDASGKDYAVWLGHSTVLIKANGKTIITDPVFWDVFFFIKRKTPL